MTIDIYTGTVGSGKSYHALCEGLQKISALPHRIVVANFPIKNVSERKLKRWHYIEDMTVKDLIRISFQEKIFGKEGHGLLIIDEAGLFFNARDWNIKAEERKRWIKFFSMSRRFGYDVILIAQDVRMIDRQIRKMCEYEVKHVCANRYGWLSWLPLKTFFYVYKWSGGKFNGGLRIGFLFPWVANKYDTMKMFEIDKDTEVFAKEFGVEVT